MNIFDVINDFAEKYNFIQQKDIDLIENSEFNLKNYNKINGKSFVSICENKNIEFGTICILIDNYEEDEQYTIDTNILFSCNSEETSMEEIIQKCKFYKLIT
jgi:hypothetical protein